MKLAIRGGKPTIPRDLIKPWPYITDEDKEMVLRVLDRDREKAPPSLGVERKERKENDS